MPFRVEHPRAAETAVLVEIPHAGLRLDAEAIGTLTAPARSIGRDADLFVDELFADATSFGATVLISEMSRYYCDLNRAEVDIDAGSVRGARGANAPHGLIWRQTTEGAAAIEAPIGPDEFERRLNRVYRPYHAELKRLLQVKKARFGYAILLCAHSMPSSGRTGHTDTGAIRADVVPGSRGRTTAHPTVIDCPDTIASQRGWSVEHDTPYRGGFTTVNYGQPARRIHAVQVELNRRLYMDELTLQRTPGAFQATRDYCRELVQAMGRIPAEPLQA